MTLQRVLPVTPHRLPAAASPPPQPGGVMLRRPLLLLLLRCVSGRRLRGKSQKVSLAIRHAGALLKKAGVCEGCKRKRPLSCSLAAAAAGTGTRGAEVPEQHLGNNRNQPKSEAKLEPENGCVLLLKLCPFIVDVSLQRATKQDVLVHVPATKLSTANGQQPPLARPLRSPQSGRLHARGECGASSARGGGEPAGKLLKHDEERRLPHRIARDVNGEDSDGRTLAAIHADCSGFESPRAGGGATRPTSAHALALALHPSSP